jgi:hypothetical protein
MGKKTTPYNQVIKILADLKKEYPNCRLGQHIYLMLEDYKSLESLWNMSDKEFLYALEKHQCITLLHNPKIPRIHLDVLPSDEEIDLIIRDAEHLDTLFDEEEEEDGY